METIIERFGAGLGVLVGIIVGVVISIIVRQWEQRQASDAQFKSLISEMRFNLSKTEAWIEELARCRTAITEDRLLDWFGFFDLHSSIFRVAETMLTTGLIQRGSISGSSRTFRPPPQICARSGAEYMNKQTRRSETIPRACSDR